MTGTREDFENLAPLSKLIFFLIGQSPCQLLHVFNIMSSYAQSASGTEQVMKERTDGGKRGGRKKECRREGKREKKRKEDRNIF